MEIKTDKYFKLGRELEIIRDVIFRVVGYELKPNEFKLTGRTVYLQTSPAARTTILLKKTAILKLLAEKISPGAPQNLL